MRIHFLHQSRYRYRKPVLLLPQILRMRPREDGFQKLLSFRCTLAPDGHHLAPLLDAEGNAVLRAWFDQPVTRFDIKVEGVVEVSRENPYDFIIEPESLSLPLKGQASRFPALAPSLAAAPASVKALSKELLKASKGETLAYINAALSWVNANTQRLLRLQGEAWESSETLKKGEGSCRDLSVLFMDLCRSQGLAARFVSGYFLEHPSRREHDLHAWAEVYIPGGGWRGFDPSSGLACGSSYVPLCAAARASDCAPVEGLYSGSGGSEFESSVELKGQA